jgi:arylformamidase
VAEVDYEAEYNARAMVPEHPEIFARWTEAAARYRGETRCDLGLAFGDTPRRAMDIFLPAGRAMAMFIHGGWWRSLDRSMFSHMARGLNAHGIAVAVVGYDLCPAVSIGDIVEQIRRACVFLDRRVVVVGHSAGGHLAAAMAATERNVTAGYAISGVFDLEPLVGLAMNADWKLDADSARVLSPCHLPKPEVPFDAVVGALESNEFRRQSRVLAEAWEARYLEAIGTNHFTVLDPLSDPDSAMVARLSEFCARTIS